MSVVGLLTALILGLAASFTPAESVLLGDLTLYEGSMVQLFSGHIPYIEFAYEHMPLSILPMAGAYFFSQFTGATFVLFFGLGSLMLLFATGEVVSRIGARIGVPDAGYRWVWIVAPILPLAMFRVDVLSVLLASLAILLAIRGRPGMSMLSTVGGILAKGWPVVGAASSWWMGRRREAAILIGGTAVLGVALVATPGFRSGRSFQGIHDETLVGGIVAMLRTAGGHDPGLINAAGAVYIQVGRWAIAATLVFGLTIAVWSLRVLRTRFSWVGGISLTAALTFALTLGSPLLSAQFVLWPMPFVALSGSRGARIALSAAGGLSMLLVGYWLPGSPWWHGLVVVRNLVLLMAAAYTMRDLQRHAMNS